jgi:hypothetical protein
MQRIILSSLVFAILGVLAPRPALAHCDTMDGPVVKAAQKALADGNGWKHRAPDRKQG